MVMLIIIFLVLLLILFWGLSNLISVFGGVVYVGTDSEIIRKALKLAGLKKGDKFYELGSGFGDGLMMASMEFGARAIGIEISPFHYLISKIRTLGDKNIKIILANYKKINLSHADVVYCYLLPKLMNGLLPKFSRELKLGTKVISYAFPIQVKTPFKIKVINQTKIYLYKF